MARASASGGVALREVSEWLGIFAICVTLELSVGKGVFTILLRLIAHEAATQQCQNMDCRTLAVGSKLDGTLPTGVLAFTYPIGNVRTQR